jgi:hypothetical protein
LGINPNQVLTTLQQFQTSFLSNYTDHANRDKHRIQVFFLSLQHKLWFVEEWKGCVLEAACLFGCYFLWQSQLGVIFDGSQTGVK